MLQYSHCMHIRGILVYGACITCLTGGDKI
jgi:hypothetical protein